METKISVREAKDVDRTNAHEVMITDPLGEEEVKTAWTNSSGCGLWVDGQQVMGAAEFNFSGPASIRAYFANRYR